MHHQSGFLPELAAKVQKKWELNVVIGKKLKNKNKKTVVYRFLLRLTKEKAVSGEWLIFFTTSTIPYGAGSDTELPLTPVTSPPLEPDLLVPPMHAPSTQIEASRQTARIIFFISIIKIFVVRLFHSFISIRTSRSCVCYGLS